MKFYVVGGSYTDTSFTAIRDGGVETRLGPFATHEEAKAAWQQKAWATVDDAMARWRIEQDATDAKPAFWVVGGSYTSTEFKDIVGGGEETWKGPFDTIDEARALWRSLAWESVDDAHSRWRIEKLARAEG